MCSGKTTLGRALARRLGRVFIDLDDYVADRAGMPVSEIFSRHGEVEFRRLERLSLGELAGRADAPVVACGGGTPCYGDNIDRMNALGDTVLLQCARPRLLRRLREGRAARPLIADMDDAGLERFADSHERSRRPCYERARHRFDSTYLETEDEIRDTVSRFITQFNLTQ